MTHDVNWSSYTGSSSFILAGVLLLATVVLMYVGVRFRQGKPGTRPGKFLGALLISSFVLAILTFLTAITVYGLADVQQGINFTSTNPITPVTLTAAIVTFFVILYLTHKSGARAAIGSAIVGTIAAPLIFELPFDLIVMWQTFPPSPPTLYTPLFFFPLFLVEILSFALLTLSPVMRLSKVTFFLLAGMFFVFAVWALAGFAYPSTPFPIAMNMLSKIVAFAVAISLFLRDREKLVLPARPREVSPEQAEKSSEAAPISSIRKSIRPRSSMICSATNGGKGGSGNHGFRFLARGDVRPAHFVGAYLTALRHIGQRREPLAHY